MSLLVPCPFPKNPMTSGREQTAMCLYSLLRKVGFSCLISNALNLKYLIDFTCSELELELEVGFEKAYCKL